MNQNNLKHFINDGIELYINISTGESFATVSGYARMSGKAKSTIQSRIDRKTGGERINVSKEAEIVIGGGLQSVRLINEQLICEWLPKDNPEMASKLMQLGVRGFLHTLAGYEVKSTLTKPLSAAEMFLQQAQILIQFEQKQAKLELEQQKQSEALIQQAVQIEVARVLAEQNQATIAIQQQKIDSLEASLDALRAVINQPIPTCQQTKRQRIVETMQLIGRVIFERKLKPTVPEAMREAWVQLTSKIKHSSARKDLPLQKANMERAYTKAMENWKINGGVKPRKKDYFLTYGELIEKNKIEDEALSCANTLALQVL